MKTLTFGPSFRCLWFWTVQDTTQPEELLAGFTGLESSGSGTGLTSPAAPWDFCTKINTLHLCSSQYPTFTFSITHLIPPPPPPPPPIFHNLCFSFLLGITAAKALRCSKKPVIIHAGAMTREHDVHAKSGMSYEIPFFATLTSVLTRKSIARLVGPHVGSNSP